MQLGCYHLHMLRHWARHNRVSGEGGYPFALLTGAAMLWCRMVCIPLPLQRPLRGGPGRDAAPALGGVG